MAKWFLTSSVIRPDVWELPFEQHTSSKARPQYSAESFDQQKRQSFNEDSRVCINRSQLKEDKIQKLEQPER